MPANIIETFPSTPVSDLPSPNVISDIPHSQEGRISSEETQRRIDRLRTIVQTNRKPYKDLDISSYSPDETGTKSLDQIVLQGEAGRISTNAGSNNLDKVDYCCATTPERIVRVQSDVEGAPVRGSSAHGVMFLRLGTQRGQLLDVAVKAFSSPSHAFVEYVNTEVIRQRGIQTLEPIAAIIDGTEHGIGNGTKGNGTRSSSQKPIGYYISAMEPIRSIDRLRVIREGYLNIVAGSERDKDYLEYLAMMGESLAQMHLQGIFPRDSQIKNFAVRQDGTIIPIDFENTNIFNINLYLTSPERFVAWAGKGLSVLFGSLNGETDPPIDFYQGFSGDSLWQAFDTTVFSAYTRMYEEIILARADSQQVNTDQFTQALENLELIKENLRQRVMTAKTTSSTLQ